MKNENFIIISYKSPAGQQTTFSVDKYLYNKAKEKLADPTDVDWAIKEVVYCKEKRDTTLSRSKIAREFLIDLLSRH